MEKIIRISEWSKVSCRDLPKDVRHKIDVAVEMWRENNDLPVSPLFFTGADGEQLCARQYVGVVEVDETVIEIYPKLDSSLMQHSEKETLPPSAPTDTVMRNLMWLLEVANYRDISEASVANLEEAPSSFFDLFAFLLGKNLLPELERGIAHKYLALEDDLRAVRGRIVLSEQVTRNWNRFDRVHCAWDEFTPNTPLNRLLKCACQFLSSRVDYAEASRLLKGCDLLLGDVENASPSSVLKDTHNLIFDRSIDRFKTPFELGRRLLAGIGHNLGAGHSKTFVFLMDMNEVFESYVHAVLGAYFGVSIEAQRCVGNLLRIPSGAISQFADYFWRADGTQWIGDAKYKHLTKEHNSPLRFCELGGIVGEREDPALIAAHVLSPGDVRQLTVYAELARSNWHPATSPKLMLLYPFVGSEVDREADCVKTWNGSEFWLMPVLVKPQSSVRNAIKLRGSAKPEPNGTELD